MEKLARTNPDALVDLLAERLAFERASVRLHGRLIGAVRAPHVPDADEVREALAGTRSQADEHVAWLEARIGALGGERASPTARVARLELSGIERAARGVRDPVSLVHALHAVALLAADGWLRLGRLAAQAADDEARRAFIARHREAVAHAMIVGDVRALLVRDRLVRRAA